MSDEDDDELPLEPSAEIVALFAAGVIRPKDRVLDLGCFQGDDVVYLRTGGCDAVGIDRSNTAITYAKALARSFKAHRRHVFRAVGVPEGLSDFAAASFDVVSDRLLLSNVDGGKKRERQSAMLLLREIARILKPQGLYILRYGVDMDGIATGRRGPMPDLPQSTIRRYFTSFSFRRGSRKKALLHEGRPLEARLYPTRSNYNADVWFSIMTRK